MCVGGAGHAPPTGQRIIVMAYRMLEELQNRRKEKVAIFLTFENIVGLIIVFFPVFLGTSAFPLLIRGPLCIGAAILGVMVTLDVHGLPIYEQLLWRARLPAVTNAGSGHHARPAHRRGHAQCTRSPAATRRPDHGGRARAAAGSAWAVCRAAAAHRPAWQSTRGSGSCRSLSSTVFRLNRCPIWRRWSSIWRHGLL